MAIIIHSIFYVSDVKLVRYQFWCTRCAFWLHKSLQWYSGRKKLEIRKKKLWKLYKSRRNHILCHEIEPNPSKDRTMHEGDNPSFWDELIYKFTFFLIVLFIFVFLAHLSWKLKWAFLIARCPSVCPSANFNLHFGLLLQNHWTNFDQTWHKSSLGKGDKFVQRKEIALLQGEIIAKE
jgi:hypothetical protein